MTQEQFQEIKNSAWAWYRGNMLEWAIKTLKDIPNAPDWVKGMFDGKSFEASLDKQEFIENYNDDIEAVLIASQELNWEVNFSEEQREFYKAIRDNDEYKMVDALCDMCVVSMNAGIDYKEGVMDKLSIMGRINPHSIIPSNVLSDRNIGYIVAMLQLKGYNPYKCLLETIKELETRTGAWNEQEGKWCKDLGAYTEQEAYEIAKEKGIFYNFGLEYDKKTKEPYWVSDTNHSADWKKLKIKKWYKADYTKCKMDKQ